MKFPFLVNKLFCLNRSKHREPVHIFLNNLKEVRINKIIANNQHERLNYLQIRNKGILVSEIDNSRKIASKIDKTHICYQFQITYASASEAYFSVSNVSISEARAYSSASKAY